MCEEKMDDVLKSGHFSILTISICCMCAAAAEALLPTVKLETILPPYIDTSSIQQNLKLTISSSSFLSPDQKSLVF
jgi:hypothetical protein